MTVTWHVDDLKVSHKDYHEITRFLKYLGDLYGNRNSVNRGDVHDYLGMDLDFSNKGVLQVSMIKYIKKVFDDFPELITSIVIIIILINHNLLHLCTSMERVFSTVVFYTTTGPQTRRHKKKPVISHGPETG